MKTNTIPCRVRTFLSAAMKPLSWRRTGLSAILLALSLQPLAFRPCLAVTFSGNSHIQINDPSGGLSWSNNAGVQALTVKCWFKISVPSGVSLTENMTILINRSAATASDKHAYFIYYDISKNSIQFSTKGTGGYSRTLIESVWPDRWYHVAVVRSGSWITAYVDGLEVSSESRDIGDARTTEGVCVGGWTGSGNGWRLYGEVQEVAIYQAALQASQVFERMFTDQRNEADLVGYYKFGYATNSGDFYKNFANAKPTGTDTAYPVGLGALVFEETNWKGEQSLFDSQVNGGQGAVAPLSGAFAWQHSAFSRAVPGIPFDFTIGYSPAAANNNLGAGWNHSLAPRVITEGSTLEYKLITWQGGVETWDRTNVNTSFATRHGEYRGQLVQLPDGDVEWTTPQHQVHRFRPAANPKQSTMGGRLKGIRDFNGNSLTLSWDESRAYVTNVVDFTGGSYRLNYSGQKLLTNVSFGEWQVNFTYNSSNLLASKTLTNSSGLYSNVNTTWLFYYNSNGLLDRIVDPRGNTNVLVQYDRYGRKTTTGNALGQVTRMEYGVPDKHQITTIDAEGFKWIVTYDRKGRTIAQQNPLGHVSRMTYDGFGNRVSTTDPLGNTTLMAYETNRANLIAQTNALGEVTRWTYHSFFNKPIAEVNPLGWTTHHEIDDTTGNLLRQWDDLGTLASYTYTSNGLVKTETDANGHTTTNDYNRDGFQVAETDAAGFTKRYVPNALGWSLFITNALGEVTSYAYDLNGRTVRTVDALNRVYAGTYDGNGNLLTQTDAKGQQALYTYDALNQKTSEVDRSAATTRVTYTSRGKPAFTTNALGHVSAIYYDAANRQTRVVDAAGNSPTTIYDAAGNVVCVIDEAGQRWTKTYDALKRVVAESDPLGNTTRTFYDAAGRVWQTTAPDGSTTRQSYDGRGRITNRVDAAGSVWRYEYDSVGNLTRITDALGGIYRMGYDVRNARTDEINQDGKTWSYTYDALERLKTQHEPNGTERTVAYDEGGRVAAVSFNTGRIDSFLYDDNDNPVVLSRTGSGPPTISQLAYDPMDRVQQYTDAFSKSVRYAYDAAGRMTNLTYPDGKTLTQSYDARDRLTNQVFQFSPGKNFATSYAYDRVSRLIRRTFPNGIVQTNAFDNAGRLTGLSHAPLNPQPAALNIAVACTYDRNGNTTVARHQGMFPWPQPAPLDETSRFTAAGRITSRVDTLTATRNFTYRHDENGNMTNCIGGGQTWTLTYDEDNRSTSMLWDPSLTTKFITNRYDAFGRRVAKTADGLLTGYVLDLAGDMERILCELNPSRAITAWYVHGLDLAFKVGANGTLTCYHADAQGNIVALTDDQANTVAEYAYTPYGRSLASTGTPATLSNRFLFAGSQGVMSEEQGVPGLFFMRARYYSAEAGVFLSTDPVKNIGPTWIPIAYAYAEGNPLRFSDPSGEFFNLIAAAVGAAVGAVVGAVVETVVQVASGTSLSDLDWGRIGGAALTGGIMGFVGGATMGASLLVQAAAGLAVGGFAAMAGKAVDEGSSFKWDWTDFAIGAAGGLMQGAGSRVGEKVVGKFFKASVGKFTSTLNVMGKKSQLIFGKTLTLNRVGWFRDLGDGVMEKVGFAESSFLFGGVKGFFSSGFKKAGEAAANPNWWP